MATAAAPRWHDVEDDDQAGREAAQALDWIRKNDTARTRSYQDDLSLYEGRKLAGLNAAAYLQSGKYETDDYKRLTWNIPRSLVQTVAAKLAGKNRPKVSFVTNYSSWQQRRRAFHLDRFVEAQFHQRQGQYENAWEVGAALVVHAAIFGDGIAYVYADKTEQQPAVEILYPWQVYVDAADAACGRPRCIFVVRPVDRDKLAGAYPDHDEAIKNAKGMTLGEGIKDVADAYLAGGARVCEQVEVLDVWVLPSGPNIETETGEPGPDAGQHLRYIDGVTLERETWTRNEFPLVRLPWARNVQGWWSQSLVSEVRSVSDEINRIVERLSDCVRLTQKATCLAPENCVKTGDLKNNEDCTLIEYDQTLGKPDWVSPAPFDQATVEWLRMNLEQCYAIPGVSQMSATSRKEQGVTAAIAMRTVQDVETERFGIQQNAYEQLFVVLCRHMIAATRELAAEDPEYAVTWPGQSFLREIKWRDVDLPDDQYVMRPDPVSHLKNTPADLLQLAQDMYGAGVFSSAALQSSIKYLDTKDHLGASEKQQKLIDRYIESWLDATPDKLESGEFKFRGPFPYLNLPGAMLQVAEAYVDAQMDEAPDFNTDFFLRYIEQADEIVQERAAAAAETQAMAAAPPADMAGLAPAPPAPPMPMPVAA